MTRHRPHTALLVFALVFVWATSLSAQSKGVKAISGESMKPHLQFLGAKEFRGRSAPSAELDIAAKYLALEASRIGLQPLMPDGSFFQQLPVEVTTISPAKSLLRVIGPGGEMRFHFPQAFTANVRTGSEWAAAGGLVFVGSALGGATPQWDDSLGIDLRGRFAVLLEVPPAGGGTAATGQAAGAARTRVLRDKGAIGAITIISREREHTLAGKRLTFDVAERLRFLDVDTVNPAPQAPAERPVSQPTTAAQPTTPFYTAEVRHDVGAHLLGISADELGRLFDSLSKGDKVAPKAIPDRTVEIAVFFDRHMKTTPNVVAYLPGSDPVLRNEYVVIGSHHDHNPPREGRIFPGADDNGSGSVAMLAIARAMMIERPRRSVIFVWHTAEERGLVGAYYFVQHCPVPVERITANLNLDMISRNDPNSIYLIGSNKLSSELDRSLHDMNNASVKLKLDYRYEDPGEPNRFFFRSDQYPYIRYGIPGVWLFCGTTPDYHQEGDVEEKVDYAKMEKVTRLTYLVAMDIGNKPALLKLDLHPEVTTRGSHNMKVVWQRPATPR